MRNDPPRPLTVGLVATPESSAAVLYGLQEVCSSVGEVWTQLTGEAAPVRRMKPLVIGAATDAFKNGVGAAFAPESDFANAPPADLVFVGDLAIDNNIDPRGRWPEATAWVRARFEAGAMICSVCTGGVLLAEAGLLNGLEATTHWAVIRLFENYYPTVKLKPEKIIVPAGPEHRIVTGGGSAAWAEVALYAIARFCGEAEALRIAKVFLLGDHSEGQLPFAAMVRQHADDDAVISDSQVWLADNYAAANPVAKMAERSGMSTRTFVRRFRRATGYAPLEYVQTLRIEEAKQFLETSDERIEDIAQRVGYEDAAPFRKLFRRKTGVTPSRYRQRWNNLKKTIV